MIPDYLVSVGGVDYTRRFHRKVTSIQIHDADGMDSDSCELEFDNKDNKIVVPPTGDFVEVALGYRGDLQPMGRFIVTDRTLRGVPLSLSLSCKAADLRATLKERNFDQYDDLTVEQIVKRIAGRNGLKASVLGAVGQYKYSHLAQNNESDLALIRRISKDHDAVASYKMGELIFAKKGEIDFGTLTIVPRQVTAFEFPLRDRPKYAKASACYWDSDKPGRKLELIVGGDGKANNNLGTYYPDGKKQAQQVAQSKNDALRREAKTCSLSMVGNPRLKAEMRVNLKGFGAQADGLYRVKEADHDFSEGGYVTDIEGEAI